jgi:predicted  nucleic acid-binding Zn-ribbon protein
MEIHSKGIAGAQANITCIADLCAKIERRLEALESSHYELLQTSGQHAQNEDYSSNGLFGGGFEASFDQERLIKDVANLRERMTKNEFDLAECQTGKHFHLLDGFNKLENHLSELREPLSTMHDKVSKLEIQACQLSSEVSAVQAMLTKHQAEIHACAKTDAVTSLQWRLECLDQQQQHHSGSPGDVRRGQQVQRQRVSDAFNSVAAFAGERARGMGAFPD